MTNTAATESQDLNHKCDGINRDFQRLEHAEGYERKELLSRLSEELGIGQEELHQSTGLSYQCNNSTHIVLRGENNSSVRRSGGEGNLPTGEAVKGIVSGDDAYERQQENLKLEEQAQATAELTGISVEKAREHLRKK